MILTFQRKSMKFPIRRKEFSPSRYRGSLPHAVKGGRDGFGLHPDTQSRSGGWMEQMKIFGENLGSGCPFLAGRWDI
jgi:hypothetical protein